MGMDVSGRRPDNDTGKYFRANVWSWRPLWDITRAVAPDIVTADIYDACQLNDGQGVEGAIRCKELAVRLRGSNYVEQIQALDKVNESTPNEACEICDGTGKRLPPPDCGAGKIPCNGCEHTGWKRPISTWYSTNREHFEGWIEFLDHCGGFEVW